MMHRLDFKHAVPALAGLAAFAGCVALAAPEARGAASPWFDTPHGAVRLIAASDAAGTGESVPLGLQFRMKPGWKIYWRSPGDAGFPPQLDWSGSDNLAEARLAWPAPERFSVLGLETLGYRNEVVLPIAAAPARPGEAMRLSAKLRYLTCDDICVPYDTVLALAIPPGPETSSLEAEPIARFAARVPARDGGKGLAVAGADLAGAGNVRTLHVDVRSDRALVAPDLFVEGPEGYSYSKPSASVADDRARALMRVTVTRLHQRAAGIEGAALILTVVDGARAVEARVTPAVAAPPPAPPVGDSGGLAAALLLALLGGLVLNLMPCVLPVLSIKLLAVVGHGGGDRGRVRAGFAASSAGIVAAFLVLGTVAVGLKEAGLAAGWGIQFQQPVFLAAMIVVLALFAGNLWGLFAIGLPGAVTQAAAGAGRGPGLGGSFVTGALATLLATPCSAPFLGTAVGFALARGPLDIYAVFLALGIGLAVPYLAVALWPGLATRLPRPGHWMVTLRRVLGVALIGTAAWLAVVLWSQAGRDAAVTVAVLAAAALGALAFTRRETGWPRRVAWGVVGALAALSIGAPARMEATGSDLTAPVAAEAGPWRTFSAVAIGDEVRLGRVVVVDVTADWCITCRVNKAAVLDREPVRSLLAEPGVTAMLADWTRPDPVIAGYLAGFGRYGIPFTAVYGPGAPRGIALPELLTASAVTEAVAKARSATPIVSR
jgi:suppressor for copper-sensitivity B